MSGQESFLTSDLLANSDMPVPRVVLASGSPRRAMVLRGLGVDFSIESPDVDETPLPGEAPSDLVTRLATAKAGLAVDSELRLAVDTVVVLDGVILGKPSDPTDAVDTLLALSERVHTVLSGCALAGRAGVTSGCVSSRVRFRAIDRNEAVAYVATGEPLDKAGSYGLQGFGSRFVSSIEGSISNVIGLPVEAVVPMLTSAGAEVPRPWAAPLVLRRR